MKLADLLAGNARYDPRFAGARDRRALPPTAARSSRASCSSRARRQGRRRAFCPRRRSPPARSPSRPSSRPRRLPDDVAFVQVANARRALALAAARSFRASRPPSPPSPAPAARPRSPPSPARSGARSGMQAASIGTIGVVSPQRRNYGSLTTPDPVELHRTLDRLAGEGVTPSRAGSVLARPRPAPARRRARRRRRLHQSVARPSRLSSDHRSLSRRQAAAVRGPDRAAAAPR